MNEIYTSIKQAESALEHAIAIQDVELVGKSHFDLGESLLALGDLHMAREHLLAFLSRLAEYPQLQGLAARAQHNLGLVCQRRRAYEQAIASFRLAARLFADQHDERMEMESVRGQIWCHLTLGQHEEALPLMEQVASYLKVHTDPQLSTSMLTDRAYYHQRAGNLSRSLQFCEEALMPDRPGVDDATVATACVIAGENCVELGRLREGRIFESLATEYAMKAKAPFLMNWATALRRRLFDLGESDE